MGVPDGKPSTWPGRSGHIPGGRSISTEGWRTIRSFSDERGQEERSCANVLWPEGSQNLRANRRKQRVQRKRGVDETRLTEDIGWVQARQGLRTPNPYSSRRALESYWRVLSKGVLWLDLHFKKNHFPLFCMLSLSPQYSASGANDTFRICKCEKKAISISGLGGFVYNRIQLSNGGCQPLRD